MMTPTNRKRGSIWKGLQLLLILVLVGTSGILSSGCTPKEPIKVAVLGTLSGAGSDLSISGRRGVELAIEDLNKKGGIQGRLIEMVAFDDQNKAETAVAELQNIKKSKAVAVIGPYTSGMAMAIVDQANADSILVLAPTVSADTLSEKDDLFIRFIASTKEQAQVLSQSAIQNKINKMAIIFDERNKGFTDQLVKNYQTLMMDQVNQEVPAMGYNPTSPDHQEAIDTFLKNTAPEGLFIIASAEECALKAQLIKKEYKDLQLYGPLWANTAELIKKGGAAVDGMILVSGMDIGTPSESYKAFIDAFQNAYGAAPTFASLYSYEAMMALSQALAESSNYDAASLKAKIINKKYTGLQSTYTIDANGDNTRTYRLTQVKNGKMEKVE